MYTPSLFKQDDASAALRLMRENAFATLITVVGGEPFVSHLPVLATADPSGEGFLLEGHLARANPHWRYFRREEAGSDGPGNGGETLFIFHGPHTYVTPGWYRDPLNVPTWNYAVVHAYARPEPVEDYESLHGILARAVEEFERPEPKPWRFEVPEDFKQDLARGIVGFKARVSRWEGKFKLSQNRAPEDRAGVIEGLRGRRDEQSRGVLRWMTG